MNKPLAEVSVPPVVVVELSSGLCNSKCVWCFTSYKGGDRIQRGMMKLPQFTHLIQLNRSHPFAIIPFGHGEALINPDFVKCCRYALSQGFSLRHVHTNLAMDLESKHFDVLSEFDHVIVNVGGGTAGTHALNTSTSLEKVLSNLRLLAKQGGEVVVKMVLNRRNIDEVKILREKVDAIASRISVRTYPVYFGPIDSDAADRRLFFENNLATPDGSAIDVRVPCRDRIELDESGAVMGYSKLNHCWGLTTTVRWNGAVSICCRSRYQEMPVGNALEQSILEIYNSQSYRDAEALGSEKKYVDYCKYCS